MGMQEARDKLKKGIALKKKKLPDTEHINNVLSYYFHAYLQNVHY
jgi:hypothetical protein